MNPLIQGLDSAYYATSDNGLSSEVLYSETAPESYSTCLKLKGCLTCCDPYTCFGIRDYIRSQHSVIVFENYMEINQPVYSGYNGGDAISTVYASDTMLRNVEKAGSCSPGFTHCSFCPTCFDMCGEGVVIYRPKKKTGCCDCCKCGAGTPFCGVPGEHTTFHQTIPAAFLSRLGASSGACCTPKNEYLVIWPVRDSAKLIEKIKEMRDSRKFSAPFSSAEMNRGPVVAQGNLKY